MVENVVKYYLRDEKKILLSDWYICPQYCAIGQCYFEHRVISQMEPDHFQAYLVVANIFTELVKKQQWQLLGGKPDPQVFAHLLFVQFYCILLTYYYPSLKIKLSTNARKK